MVVLCCRPVVVPQHPAQPRAARHSTPTVRHPRRRRRARWRPEFDRRVRPLPVVVPDVLGHQMVEVAGAHDEEPVEALDLHRLDESLDVRTKVRRPVREPDGLDAVRPQRAQMLGRTSWTSGGGGNRTSTYNRRSWRAHWSFRATFARGGI